MPKPFALRRPQQAVRSTLALTPDEADTPTEYPAPSADELRTAAYHRWEAAGRPAGDGVEFWLAAEREYEAGSE